MGKFTFGSLLEQEITQVLEEQRRALEVQIKTVKETASRILEDMAKTKSSYDDAATVKLNSMDKTLNDKVSSMQAVVTQQTAGLVNRVSTLESDNSSKKTLIADLEAGIKELSAVQKEAKTKISDLEGKAQKIVEDSIAALKRVVDKNSAILSSIAKAANGG